MCKKLTTLSVFVLFLFATITYENFLTADDEITSWKSKNDRKFNPNSNPYVFVILSHVRNANDDKLWRRCYQSIKKFHPEAPIVIIDDNSRIPISDNSLDNTILIRSEYPGAGELLPYHYFLTYKWAKKMVFLHDSMFLKRPFSNSELNHSVKFLWHFQDHTWDDDQTINMLLAYLPHSADLINYNIQKKSQWNGCFGVVSIIDLNLLEQVESKYAFTGVLKK